MLRKWVLKAVWPCLIVLILLSAVTGFADTLADSGIAYDTEGNAYIPDQFIISYVASAADKDKKAIKDEIKALRSEVLPGIRAELVRVEKGNGKAALALLKTNKKVAYAEPDYIARTAYVPNDPGYVGQKQLPLMRTPEAWDVRRDSSNILVAVLDSGITMGNTDMKNKVVGGYNFIANNTVTDDDYGHGTQVSSVIGAIMNNNYGIAGIAPMSDLLAVKVVDSTGSGSYSNMIKGIDYAIQQGAKVINMSMGGRASSVALQDAVNRAISKGVVIVAAAGNEGSTALSYPAAFDNVIGVGAVDASLNKMSYSNTGKGLTIMASGTAQVATKGTLITGASGTSYSSPYVAGLVALMLAENESLSPAKVMDIIGTTAKDLGAVGYDSTYGYGLVDMGSAMKALTAVTPITDTVAPVITLNGESSLSMTVNSVYTEAGATAIDAVDGDISASVTISGAVDTAKAGVYTLSYQAFDKAGNGSPVLKRTVEILEQVTDATTEAVTEDTTETTEPIEDIPLETKVIRPVEIVKGSLSKKVQLIEHTITIVEPGQLDISVSYTGKSAPTVKLSGYDFSGTSGTFNVISGSYVLSFASSATISYTATITYPEKVVSADTPLSTPEVILYGRNNTVLWMAIIVLVLAGSTVIWMRYRKAHQ
jgi:thermitase